MKASVLFARFPFGNQECPSSVDWLIETMGKATDDPRIHRVSHTFVDDTPITMGRNRVMEYAEREKFDLLVMIDSDMFPDLCLKDPRYSRPDAKPFWETALDFTLAHRGPCVVAAPYCGPPPEELVYIFQPTKKQSDHPNVDIGIEMIPREDAAKRGGIEEVFALPTGLMMIDMRCVGQLKHPYFDYEPTSEKWTHKATTEDVYFSRNLSLAGIPQYCLWPCWAGHWKRKLVGPPTILTLDNVREQYRDAIVRGYRQDESLIVLGDHNAIDPSTLPHIDGPERGRPRKKAKAKK